MSKIKLGMAYATIAKMEAELSALREERDQYQRIYNHASSDLCTIGELLGVDEDNQSTSAVIEAIKALREQMAQSNAAHNVAAENHAGLNTTIFTLEQRLTAADQRNSELVEHLEGLKHRCEIFIRGDDGRGMNVDGIRHTLVLVNAAIKSTESGASK